MVAQLQHSIHGRSLYLTPSGYLATKGPIAFSEAGKGSQRAYGSPNIVELWDDFYGDVISDEWNSRKGTDGAATDWAVNVQVNGVIRGVTGANASADMAGNGVQLDSALNWKPNQGGLAFEARVKSPTSVASLALYMGFTDQTSALEMPFTLSAGSLTSNATDGVGFLFDTAATAATMKLVGVANDVDATVQDTGAAYISTSAFHVFRVEVEYDAVADAVVGANFFIDGAQVGTTMTTPTTKSIALTPVIAAFRRTATLANIDVDYVHVSALRA